MTLSSEVSSLAHSLSLDVQELTECCEYMSQHGHCVVDAAKNWNIETEVYRSQRGHLTTQNQITDAEVRQANNVKQATPNNRNEI